jgi:membrane-associated phospholipid phosphatase
MASFHLWHTASIVYFFYMLLVAAWRGPSTRPEYWRVVVGSGAGLAMVLLSVLPGQPDILTDWIGPPVVLLISYWTSGWMFRIPDERQERLLASVDGWAGVSGLARRIWRPVAETLEIAYLGVYALVPIALLLHLEFSVNPSTSRFWAVILITDYVCFGALPWIQTRPPRALEKTAPWNSSVRRLNLQLLDSASVQVNTFPSGHAAEAMASALLVLDAPGPVAGGLLVAGFLVSAGAVLGRYHYLTDALVGWLVAVIVWAAVP